MYRSRASNIPKNSIVQNQVVTWVEGSTIFLVIVGQIFIDKGADQFLSMNIV